MCMMTVKYRDKDGERILMSNVTELIEKPHGVELTGLLDGSSFQLQLRVERIDFSHGMAWLCQKEFP